MIRRAATAEGKTGFVLAGLKKIAANENETFVLVFEYTQGQTTPPIAVGDVKEVAATVVQFTDGSPAVLEEM